VRKLDSQVAAVLARLPQIERDKMTPDEARRASRERAELLRQDREPVARVEEREVPTGDGEVRVRTYAPAGRSGAALIYLHGGGWVLGDLDGPDALCRAIANRASCLVVSVEYPLAPERKFPAALEASYAVTRWVSENASDLEVDMQRLGVGGESAGGNLAAAVALLARDRGGPPLAFQLLLVPVMDHAFDTVSYVENADGYGLTRAEMMWFWRHYLRDDAEGANAYASPLRAPDLHGLPRALVVTAEFDPLRDEGEAYARRLSDAGVPVELRRIEAVVHGFLGMAGEADVARRAVDGIVHAVRDALAAAADVPRLTRIVS
jgi:acetyl esterase